MVTLLDSAVAIGFLDTEDEHHSASVAAMNSVRESNDDLMISTVTFAEMLIGPMRKGPRAVEAASAFASEVIGRIEPVTVEVARAAARLRISEPGVPLPDALILATAEHHSADRIVTGDRRWRAVPGLRSRVELLGSWG